MEVEEQRYLLAYYDGQITSISNEITALSPGLDIDNSGDINLPEEFITQDLIQTLNIQLQNLVHSHQQGSAALQAMQTAFATCAD